jgi:hypothetical protein
VQSREELVRAAWLLVGKMARELKIASGVSREPSRAK